MPNLEAQAAWVPVREIGIELARGGPNGNMNEQATALLARTEWLNQQKASKSEIVQGVFEFGTYAEFNAAKATLPVNCTVIINEMPTGTQTWGQGTNRWNGTTLSKSAYDPLTQAKVYTDNSLPTFTYQYLDNNMVGSNSLSMKGAIYGDSQFRVSYGYSVAIPVVEGEILFLHNSQKTTALQSGFAYGFFPTLPNEADGRQTGSVRTLVDSDSSTTYHQVIVPDGCNYLVLNTSFGGTTAEWNVNKKGFNPSFSEGTEYITELNGTKLITDKYLEGVEGETTSFGDIYNPLVIRQNSYITNSIPQKISNGSAGWTVAVMPMEIDSVYYAKLTARAYPFQIAAYNDTVEKTILLPSGSALIKVDITLIDATNDIYKLTPSEEFTGGSLLITTKVIGSGYNHDISTSLKVWKDFIDLDATLQIGYSSLFGNSLIDSYIRKKVATLTTSVQPLIDKITDKPTIYCFGDSITQGTQGGYVGLLATALNGTASNFGSSGGNSNRLYGIMLGKLSRNSYDSGAGVYPTKDYTKADIVTIMIGTNDHSYSTSYWSSWEGMPTDTVYDHVATETTDAYFENFPRTFAGNVGACIEYVQWKNPKCRIYLITPPMRGATPSVMGDLVKYQQAIADYYSVPLINATQESGLSLKNISQWSYDNLHLNTLGNEIFAKYLAKKIASS